MGQVGWIMSCYGLGSVIGVYFGGKLSDHIGYYKVMLGSLFTTGLVFIGLGEYSLASWYIKEFSREPFFY